jgi:hypothetical protein
MAQALAGLVILADGRDRRSALLPRLQGNVWHLLCGLQYGMLHPFKPRALLLLTALAILGVAEGF